jgi:hypothetical protein
MLFGNENIKRSRGAHQFVVGGVVANLQDTSALGSAFAGPGKVSVVETKGTEL